MAVVFRVCPRMSYQTRRGVVPKNPPIFYCNIPTYIETDSGKFGIEYGKVVFPRML